MTSDQISDSVSETAGATETATVRDGNGDTITPDDSAQIFAAIDCNGTRSETATRTAPAILGALWQGMPAVSESISSPSSIVARLPDADLDRLLLATPRLIARAGALRLGAARAALLRQVGTATAPAGPSAGISAGVKLRICPECGERPVRGHNRGECKVCHAAAERERRPIREAEKQRALRLVRARGLKLG